MRNTTGYKLAGTETFRISSAKLLGKWGGNLQNVEKYLRKIYIPDDGKVFVQVDQSGAEALVVAYLTREGRFRQLFKVGIKSHVYVALCLFSDVWQAKLPHLKIDEYIACPIATLTTLPGWKELDKLIKSSDSWPSAERYYYMAKQVCHSANYSIGANEFALNVLKNSEGQIALSSLQAGTFLAKYNSLFPEIKQWHLDIQLALKMTRTLRNLQGFPRKFYGPLNDKTYKEAYAFIPQSTVGTITNIAVTRLQNYIEAEGLAWDLLTSTHDSYLVQCPESDASEASRIMREFINQRLVNARGEEFFMRSEASIGKNWKEMA